jgi:hypothetical protein
MAENKFIERLQGKGTEKSVVEIKNTATPTMFTNMPAGDSNGFNTYSDHRGNATVVSNGTMNWKVDSLQTLTPANIVNGNGEDFTTSIATSGAGLWINAEYTFPSTGDPNHPVAMVFNPQTKWILKVCGDNLLSPTSNTIDFTVLITFGSSNIISKTFTVAEQANKFCKEFVIDFAESNTNIIKAQGLSIMKLQLLCGTADASANIYGGMTVLTCLQRKVEAVAISSTFANVEEVLRDGLLPNDYFSNGAYIVQVTDGDTAYAVFQRDGDEMLFVGWNQPIPDQTGNSGKFLMTNGSLMSWEQLTISDVDGLQDDLDDLQGQITTNKGTMDNHIANTNNPHSVTAAQVGALPNTTKYGAALSLTINSTTYVVTAQLKDQDGNNLGTAQTIDLPLESVVVSGAYDSATKEVVLTLQDGSKIRFSVADLVSGLQTEITALNMLSADLVDDTNTTHKFVTTTEKSTWNGKQDAISDLATIRNNAQAGKAASDTIATYGDIVTHDVAEFATAAQGAKADSALQPGDNVSELTNDAGYLVMGDLTNFVTKNTAQTISGLKTFSADIVLSGTTSIKNTTSGVSYTMLYRDTSGIHVGTSTQALLLAGSNARPKFNNNDIAMLADIPTAVSQLTNDSGFITNAVNNLQNYTLTSDLATVATSGSYNDLSNKPTIPAAQVNSDWNANSGVAQILNKPTLATVATSGSYNDLSNKPTIPTVNNPTITITQGGITKGSFTLNQASGDTIALDAGGGGSVSIDNITITTNADDEIQAVGTVNQNTATGATNPIKSWLGDINEYNNQSVPTSNPDALCFIVDKTQTATDRYIVEAQYPDDTNGYTWYFLYSDGWVEQGGAIVGLTDWADRTITLPVPMSDRGYSYVQSPIMYNAGGSGAWEVGITAKTETQVSSRFFSNNGFLPTWEVKGMAA